MAQISSRQMSQKIRREGIPHVSQPIKAVGIMFAVKGLSKASAFWFSPGAVLLDDVHGRGQSCKTTVEQALMRGLVTA